MENNALIEVKQINPIVLFSEDGALEKLLQEKIRIKLDEFVPDVSSDVGRKEIVSMAFKVSRSKTLLDDIRKKHIEKHKAIIDQTNSIWKPAREKLDQWRNEVRQPVTDWEAEQEKIKAEEERLEKITIQGRVEALQKVGVVMGFFDLAMLTDEEYETKLGEATETYNIAQAVLRKEEDDRKAESESLAKQKAIAAAREIALEEERALFEAEKKKLEIEKKALEDAKKAELERIEREAFEKQATENARVAAEKAAAEKVENDAREAKEAEERARAEAERLEALKPDKEKLISWIESIMSIPEPEVTTDAGNGLQARMRLKLNQLLDFMMGEIKEL